MLLHEQVVQLLPWLLVATAPLQPQELLRLATQRALTYLLDLSLVLTQSRLSLRGVTEQPQSQEHGVLGVAAAVHRMYIRCVCRGVNKVRWLVPKTMACQPSLGVQAQPLMASPPHAPPLVERQLFV
jgi:hypothetical protein